jgi:hypothetical protein
MGAISDLVSDVGSVLFNLTKGLIKMKESHDVDKTWKQRRKKAFYKHIKKYIDENSSLDIDNFMSRDSLHETESLQLMENSRFAVHNPEELKDSKYELMLTIMDCTNTVKDVALRTIHAKNDVEARIKANHTISSIYLEDNKKNFAYAHITNINRFFKKVKIDKIEMSKYLEILYHKQDDELFGFYIKDENGTDINFNYFKMEE